jgi:SAM-dependent methyltransferase
VQHASLRSLDALYQVVLAPFRRRRVTGRSAESSALVGSTDAFNKAAEEYFSTFRNAQFLLDKPFSETHLAAKHLIDAGVLIDAMRLRPGDVVAEIGAGSGWLSQMLNRFGCATIAIDVSPTAVALSRQLFERDSRTKWTLEPRFLSYDGRVLPLEDASCDRIVINDAFHHIPNQRELLAEMHRVLRPDGVVAMSEPGYGHAAAEHSVEEAAQGVLENELVLEDVAALAESVGFRETTIMVASPLVRREIPARDLGAFMGGKHFASYWKALCSGLEQHHYILLHKGPAEPTTRRPSRLTARIEVVGPSKLRITNIGDTRWLASSAGGGWTRIGAHLYRDAPNGRELLDFDWYRHDLPRDVAPGDQITVDLDLPQLREPGRYHVVFDLVAEGLTWFADRGSAVASIALDI